MFRPLKRNVLKHAPLYQMISKYMTNLCLPESIPFH